MEVGDRTMCQHSWRISICCQRYAICVISKFDQQKIWTDFHGDEQLAFTKQPLTMAPVSRHFARMLASFIRSVLNTRRSGSSVR